MKILLLISIIAISTVSINCGRCPKCPSGMQCYHYGGAHYGCEDEPGFSMSNENTNLNEENQISSANYSKMALLSVFFFGLSLGYIIFGYTRQRFAKVDRYNGENLVAVELERS